MPSASDYLLGYGSIRGCIPTSECRQKRRYLVDRAAFPSSSPSVGGGVHARPSTDVYALCWCAQIHTDVTPPHNRNASRQPAQSRDPSRTKTLSPDS